MKWQRKDDILIFDPLKADGTISFLEKGGMVRNVVLKKGRTAVKLPENTRKIIKVWLTAPTATKNKEVGTFGSAFQRMWFVLYVLLLNLKLWKRKFRTLFQRTAK